MMTLFWKRKKEEIPSGFFDTLRHFGESDPQEVTFKFDKGNVKFWIGHGKVLAAQAKDFFPINVNARSFWDKNIDKQQTEAINSVINVFDEVEGFSKYVEVVPELAETIASYYVAKEISIAQWVADQYKTNVVPEISVKKSTTSIKVPESSYEEAFYSTLSIDELEELAEAESSKIRYLNELLGVIPADYATTVYSSLSSDFDGDTPFESDAENIAFSAAAKSVNLKKVHKNSGGFLWSEILEAIKDLKERNIIANQDATNSFFDEGLKVALAQGIQEIEQKEEVRLEDETLDNMDLNLENVFSIRDVDEEPDSDKDITLEVDSLFEISEGTVNEKEEDFEAPEFKEDDIFLGFTSSEDEPVSEFFSETLESVTNGEPLPQIFAVKEIDSEEMREIKDVVASIPEVIKNSNSPDEELDATTVILEEIVDYETLLESIDADIAENISVYRALQNSSTIALDERKAKRLNSAWQAIEALEKDRAVLVTAYLENLYSIEETLSSLKEAKEEKKKIRYKIQHLENIENIAFYSSEEQIDEFGSRDDVIREAIDNGVFEKFNEALANELEIEREAVDPYSDENLAKKDLREKGSQRAIIFERMIKESGLGHLF